MPSRPCFLLFGLLLALLWPACFGFSAQKDSAQNLMQLAKQAFERGDYKRSITYSTSALEKEPSAAAMIRYSRGAAYAKTEAYDSAIKDFDETIRLRPQFVPGYIDRGLCYTRKGLHQKAMSDFNTAIRLDPKNARAYRNRADLKDDMNRPDDAMKDYNTALRLKPDYADAFYNRANGHYIRRDYPRAIADYSHYIRLNPKGFDAYYNRGRSFKASGDLSRAIADFSRALRINSTYIQAYTARASANLRQNDRSRAIADARKALSLKPQDASDFNSLGWLLATYPEPGIRNGKEAVRMSQRACELSRWRDANKIDTLAAAYAELGEFEQAVKYQTQAVAMSFSSPSTVRQGRVDRLTFYQKHKAYREDIDTN